MYCEIESNKLKGVIDLLNEMSDECRINAKKDGLHIKLVDGANVAMVQVDIPNTAFKKYTCDKDAKYGVDIKKLKTSINKSTRFGKVVSLHIEDNVIFERGNFSFQTYLLPIDTVRKEPRISSLTEEQISNQFIISPKNLLDTFNCMMDNYMHVTQKNGVVSMHTHDGTKDKEETAKVDFGDEITIKRGKDAHAYYNLEYLKPAMKIFARNVSNVSFEFGNNWPCIISNADGDIKFKMMLAPKIESD